MTIASTVRVHRAGRRWWAHCDNGWSSRHYRTRARAVLAARIYAAFSTGPVRYIP